MPHRSGIGQRAVASKKFRAVAGNAPRSAADVDENGLAGKLTIVHVAGEQSAGVRVGLGDHVHQVRVSPLAQNQLPVASNRQAPGPARAIAHLHHHQFHGRVECDVGPQFRVDPHLRVFKHAVAEPVTANVRSVPARGQRRRGPELTGFLIADVKCFATGVADRIVMPGGQTEFVGVVHPRVRPTAFRDHRADLRVGQHVCPWRGSGLARGERDHVLASVGREPTQTIKEDSFARRRRTSGRRQPRSRRYEPWNLSPHRSLPLDLLGQGFGAVGQDHARDRLQQDPVFLRQLFAAPQKDPTGFVHAVRFRAGVDQVEDAVLQDLTISGKILVENDQIDFQSLFVPVGMGLESLFDQIDPMHVRNAHQQDRQVARDPEGPQAGLAEPVAGEDAGTGAVQRVGMNDRAGQLCIHLCLRLGCLQLSQHDLAVRPGHVERARRETRVAIFLD